MEARNRQPRVNPHAPYVCVFVCTYVLVYLNNNALKKGRESNNKTKIGSSNKQQKIELNKMNERKHGGLASPMRCVG